MEGEAFGPYRLEALLGRGGMGEVWRAHDTRKDRDVAVKVLGTWLGADPDFARRFRRESALASRLTAPNVVGIHDYGEIDGRLFIEMPLIAGIDLGELIRQQGPLQAHRAVAIITQVARALSAAHRAGLVHRDVKPSNILVTDVEGDDHVYLIDFGIARSVDGTQLSVSGATIGTPSYMAPERFAGDGDHRSDIYALGCVLYEALTRTPPYAGTNPLVLMNAHLNAAPPRPSDQRPDIPVALDAVVARAMAKHPGRRYDSATEMITDARACLTGPPRTGPPGGVRPGADPTRPSPAPGGQPVPRPEPAAVPVRPRGVRFRRRQRAASALLVTGLLAVLCAIFTAVSVLIYVGFLAILVSIGLFVSVLVQRARAAPDGPSPAGSASGYRHDGGPAA